MDASGAALGATLFVEPETRAGRMLAERYLYGGIANVDRAPFAAALRDLHAAFLDRHRDTAELARRLVGALTPQASPGTVSDERMRGASLADAAHAAGFADSAHLARTSRRMMGIPPSLLDIAGPPQQ
jgi:AraC-like DNA-binding protein